MVYLPVTLLLFILFLLLFPIIWFVITLEVVEIAVAKLGFSPTAALLIFAAMIVGGTLNISLYQKVSQVAIIPDFADLWQARFWGIPLQKIEQKTIIALNVGGGLLPTLLAIW
jgi:uncharacterized membrane protein